MRQKKQLLERFTQRLDIPRESLPFGFGLSLSGQNALTVRGCRKILTYGRNCIRLSLGKTVLAVGGTELICTVFEAGNVTVEGHILALTFEEKGDGDAT